MMNDVFSLSSNVILIWLYLEYASIKLKSPCPKLLSMSLSMLGSEKLSFGYALFKLVKSTHIHHLPLAFLTITTFSNQWTSLMKSTSKSLLISLSITFYLSTVNNLFFFRMGLCVSLTLRWWEITLGSIPNMLIAIHAKTYSFTFKNSSKLAFISCGSVEPIQIALSGSSSLNLFSIRSSVGASLASFN